MTDRKRHRNQYGKRTRFQVLEEAAFEYVGYRIEGGSDGTTPSGLRRTRDRLRRAALRYGEGPRGMGRPRK